MLENTIRYLNDLNNDIADLEDAMEKIDQEIEDIKFKNSKKELLIDKLKERD